MAIRQVSFRCGEADHDQRLDVVLAARLEEALGRPLSRAQVRKVIVAGAVSVNGRPFRAASARLARGARVEARVDLGRLDAAGPAHDRRFVMTAAHVLYEDAQLLVVDKPPGLPTHPTLDKARDNLVAAVQRFLVSRDGLDPAAPPPTLGLHQRLDRDTSGVLILVKDRAANAAVGRLFAERLVEKTYRALTARPPSLPPGEWEVRTYLGPAPRKRGQGKRTRYRSVRSGGAPARTEFRLIEELPRGLHLEARPHTGRTHQIRVHLAEAGLPILGDDLYGRASGRRGSAQAEVGSPARLMLHASSLVLPSPCTGDILRIESPLPHDFRECLARLCAKGRPTPR